MAISPDLVSGTIGTALERSAQSTQKMSDIRRGNWLLSLEREQLSSLSRYQSPDMNASNANHDNMADGGTGNSLAVQAQQGTMSAQTSSSWQKSLLLSTDTVQASPSTSTAYPLQMEVKSGGSALIAGSDLNKVYTQQVLKDTPSLQLNEPAAADLNGPAELEIMASNSAELAAIGANDSNVAEAYTLRQIHLYSHEGKVQTWIRDTQLDEKRTVAVEAALRQDLKKNGWDLVGLTINGKQMASLLQKSQQRFQGNSVINAQQ